MGRPPIAKEKILAAARQIVEDSGAGSLTFDELVKVSGITRGGITYHFPTKEDLLRSLLESDFRAVGRSRSGADARRLRPGNRAPARIHSHLTAQDESHRRFLCGMLSAATLDPSLMDPCRQELRERLGRKKWTERDLRLHLVHLAAEGLMWQELFQMYSMPAPARARLVGLMEELARQWGDNQPQRFAKEA